MIETPRIEFIDDYKTFKEIAFYLFDEFFAIRKRFKSPEEAIEIAEKFTKHYAPEYEPMLKELERFKGEMQKMLSTT